MSDTPTAAGAMPDGKNLARALRRHHRERLIQARRVYWGRQGSSLRHCPALDPRQLGMLAQTAATCSCLGCGNPRRQAAGRKERLTIQERSFGQDGLHEMDACRPLAKGAN